MQRYDPKTIEPKWQQKWEDDGTYVVDLNDKIRPKYYGFSMLPGITGAGIHIGHGRTYQFSDIKVRAKRQQGFNAYHPIGWDSFGLPVENYAIKLGKQPRAAHDEAKVNFKNQLKRLGYSYDWSKEISTADPSYYKWTQWIFNKLLEHGLAYQKESPQWWCETDSTVLANEQVEAGKCWRCGNPVVKKNLKQWFFKITDYADDILAATKDLNWTEMVKTMQENWIGRSQGAEVEFCVNSAVNKAIILHGKDANSSEKWYPWIKNQLINSGINTVVPSLPNPENPKIDEWMQEIDRVSPDDTTMLIGHSRGGVAILRWLEKLPKGRKIGKVVLVATNRGDHPDREKDSDFFGEDYNFTKIKSHCDNFIVIHSRDDEWVPFEAAEHIAQGLSIGVTTFENKGHFGKKTPEVPEILRAIKPSIKVFTTRVDTLFGATFLVLAPEHKLASKLAAESNKQEVKSYIKQAQAKSEIERMETSREKTGVFTGSYAINPATGEKIPIWVADYVLMGYGTGAIMAVPAHDERDGEFAKKFSLPIVEVVQPSIIDPDNPPRDDATNTTRNAVLCIIKNSKDGKYLTLRWKKHKWHAFVMGGIEGDEDAVTAAKREIAEETGYHNVTFKRQMPLTINSLFYAAHKDINRDVNVNVNVLEFELENDDVGATDRAEIEDFDVEWVEKKILPTLRPVTGLDLILKWLNEGDFSWHGEGRLLNSGQFDGMNTEEAREEMTAWLEQQKIGKTITNYKMHDWLISRQRYWGAPIPIIHCPDHGAVPVPDKDLPVILPEVENYKPTGGNTSVLADATDWVNTTCPTCGEPAKRETDTLDGYACSSWYFLRYLDPHNENQAWDPEITNHWMAVDFYNGADHAVAHLLYARFWMRFFHKIGLVDNPEPFKNMMYNAYIMAPDGRKMSKSLGNVIDPLEIMDSGYGADSLRVYEMFIAPFDAEAPWDPRGVPGTYRFLNRTWNLVQEYLAGGDVSLISEAEQKIQKIAHQTIKKVTHDIEHNKFNTAVSSMMEAVNGFFLLKQEYGIGKSPAWQFAIESLLQVLAPFAPHVTEEAWQQLGHETTIHKDNWPEWDESLLIEDTMKIPVQINGKVRAMLKVAKDITEKDILELAKNDKKVATYIEGKNLKKSIYVSGRIVNLILN